MSKNPAGAPDRRAYTWEAAQAEIRNQMNELADALASGEARSYEDYRQVVGRIQGLALAERAIIDILDKENQADE